MTETGRTESTSGLTDTSDMVAVHRVFRQAVAAAPGLLGAAENGTARADGVADYYRNVLALLHGHHDGEDELLWPKLLERAGEQRALITRIASQHRDLDAALASADSALTAWSGGQDPADRTALLRALAEVGEFLTPHLDEEEREILPLAARHLSPQEWAELPAHGMRTFTGDQPWLVIGLIAEALSPAQREEMIQHMPEPARDFWLTAGRSRFEAAMAVLKRA